MDEYHRKKKLGIISKDEKFNYEKTVDYQTLKYLNKAYIA